MEWFWSMFWISSGPFIASLTTWVAICNERSCIKLWKFSNDQNKLPELNPRGKESASVCKKWDASSCNIHLWRVWPSEQKMLPWVCKMVTHRSPLKQKCKHVWRQDESTFALHCKYNRDLKIRWASTIRLNYAVVFGVEHEDQTFDVSQRRH